MAVALSSLCALAVLVGSGACEPHACGGDRDATASGSLGDTPFPHLCNSDKLVITPAYVDFPGTGADAGSDASGVAGSGGAAGAASTGDASVDANGVASGGATSGGAAGGDAGGTAGVSDGGLDAGSNAPDGVTAVGNSVDMAILGLSGGGQPREAAHVDVYLSQEADVAIVKLVAVGSSCSNLSDTRLRCVLGVDGTAHFRVARTGTAGGTAKVCASSGSVTACTTVTAKPLGGPAVGLTILEPPAEPDAVSGFTGAQELSSPLVCSTSATAAPSPCDDKRAVEVVVATVRSDSHDLYAPQYPTDVILTASGTELSYKSNCSTEESSLAVHLDGLTPIEQQPVYLCTTRAGGVYGLTAQSLGPGSSTVTEQVQVRPAPGVLRVLSSPASAGDGGTDAGQQLAVRFQVDDCDGMPLSPAKVSWITQTGDSGGGLVDSSGVFTADLDSSTTFTALEIEDPAGVAAPVQCQQPISLGTP